MIWTVEFNNTTCTDLRLQPVERPAIPAPEYDFEEVEIKGRDGTLLIDNKRKKPIEISLEFNYIGAETEWAQIWRTARKWLSAQNAPLAFSDDPDYYYRVSYVKLGENTRVTKRIGRFKAKFVCDPYMYLKGGNVEWKQELTPVYLSTADGNKILDAGGNTIFSTCLSKTILNALDRCCPIYRIVGKGVCSFSVNGNWMHATVDGEIIIDTEREVAYKPGGVKANRKITGDYEQLRLVSGKNELMTGSAFDFYITPRWRSE
nr:MAG TPA: distal tail protein [Bacteriophage sp.]